MNKHTPGPWRLEWWEYKGRPEPVLTVRTDADAVAQVMGLWRDGADDSDERQANARLIAAAPDLLAALEESERVIRWAAQEAAGRVDKEKVGGWLYHADQARAAIRKAKGD